MLVAGNVTEDLTLEGRWRPGGPALYVSRMAVALGVKVDLITRVSKEYDRTVFEGLNVHELPANTACRYQNRYDAAGARTQLLLDPGVPIAASDIVCKGADVCVLAPAYHELDAPHRCSAPVRGVLLQGALRATDGEAVVFHPHPRDQAARLVSPGAWAFLSEEDTDDADGLARALSATGAAGVFVTRGYKGATLVQGGLSESFPALPARQTVDPTGAGDCFAGAFLTHLRETGDVAAAIRFALAAGSLAVEDVGIAGIPRRDAIERRLAQEAVL